MLYHTGLAKGRRELIGCIGGCGKEQEAMNLKDIERIRGPLDKIKE